MIETERNTEEQRKRNVLEPSADKWRTPPFAAPTRATTTLALLDGKVPAGNNPSDTNGTSPGEGKMIIMIVSKVSKENKPPGEPGADLLFDFKSAEFGTDR